MTKHLPSQCCFANHLRDIAAELVPVFLVLPDALIQTVSRNVDWRFGEMEMLLTLTLVAMKSAPVAAS